MSEENPMEVDTSLNTADANDIENRDEIVSKKEDENPQLCSLCNELGKKEDAGWFCEKCTEYLCQGCKEVHSAQKLTKDHVLTPADETLAADSLSNETKRFCQTCSELGKEEIARTYCCDCDEWLCEGCTKRHAVQKISKDHVIMSVEEFEEKEQQTTIVSCEPCTSMGNKANATSFCNDCKEYLCDGCTVQHRAQKLTRTHDLVSAEKHLQETLEEKTFYCEPCGHLQAKERASAFCNECTEFLCKNCQLRHLAMKMTKDHALLSVEQYLETKRYENVTLCEPCQFNGRKVKAIYYCMDCPDPEPFCEGCSGYHKAQKSCRDHKLSKNLEELTNLLTKVEFEQPKKQNGEQCTAVENVEATSTGPNSANGTDAREKGKSESSPGKPIPKDVKTDRVTISWTPPSDFEDEDYYQIRYKNLTQDGKWRFYDQQPSKATVTISSLRPDTRFVFQVRVVHDDIEGPYSPVSDEVHTKKSPANRLFGFSSKVRDGPPDLYRLPLTENRRARNEKAKTRKFDLGAPPKVGREKTIMLVGATGTGKSTLVDGIVNYVLGVNWDDSFRYTLVDLEKDEQSKQHNQAVSQTEWVTCYSINLEEGSRLNYKLNIIDTPGFGDTRGLERDQQVVEQIRELFSAKGDQGVVYIDAVCFLIKAPDARLTAVQKYIFHAIMSLFGNDIEHNICTMITFADGDNPPVLAALDEAKLPFGNWFPFNNSGLFANNTQEDKSRSSLSPMFWEMGLKSFQSFFGQLDKLETKSLQLTQQVLTQRQRLELTIQNLQPQVDAGLSKLNELTAEVQIIEQHKTDIEANKNFTYKVTETKQVKHDLPKGQHVTNCLQCHVTCHKNCMIPRDEDKAGCWAMDSSGNCTQCSENCHWQQHANTPYIFEYIQEECTKTYEEKQEKYRRAEGEKMTHEKVVQRMEEELHDLEEDIHQMMLEVKECNEILAEIALRPNPLSMVEHIDLLIEGEKLDKQPGFMERVKVLQGFRKRAEIGKDVERFRKGVHSARQARHGGSNVTAEVVRPSRARKAYKAFTNFFFK